MRRCHGGGLPTLARARIRFARYASSSSSTYERLEPTEHVLRRPAMYIGSTSAQSEPLWLLDASGKMVHREAAYVPGLYKIFDEILVNALDNRQRDPKGTDRIAVSIEPRTGTTSISNTGSSIPVRMHETAEVYIPELIMGHLYTGSNFDDTEVRTVGGRHGFGAKLTNLFSTAFEVETADATEGLLYKQQWQSNMSIRSAPDITPLPAGATDYTTVRFTPDLGRFNLKTLPDDMLAVFRRRVYEAAATAAPAAVELNGERVPIASLADLANLYAGRQMPAKDFHSFATKNGRWKVGACISPTGSFHSVSFVNGVCTPQGGNHVSHVATPLLAGLRKALTKALKLDEAQAARALTPSRLRSHLMLFVDATIDNPEFNSQSKEALTTMPASFGTMCKLSPAFIKDLAAMPALHAAVTERVHEKELMELSRATKNDRNSVIGIKKLEDAGDAGGPRAAECTLIITEGDSAKATAVAGISGIEGRRTYGVFPLQGKPLNVRDVTLQRTSANKELTELMRALGLRPGASYKDSAVLHARAILDAAAQGADAPIAVELPKPSARGADLRYGRLMLMADQDSDGSHIKGLILSMIHKFWPELLGERFVQEFQTPLLKVKKSSSKSSSWLLKDNAVGAFFSLRDYEAWRTRVGEAEELRWQTKYYKGIGTSTPLEAQQYFLALPEHRIELELGSELDGDLIDMVFSKSRVTDRKQWMVDGRKRQADERSASVLAGSAAAEVTMMQESARDAGVVWKSRSIEDFVQTDLVSHSLYDLRRSVPSAIDGLKPSQRKVLYTCLKGKMSKANEMKVNTLAGHVTAQTAYHHGEGSLHQTIIKMAQDFVGSNNVPLLEPEGQFGSRASGGKDAAAPRYIGTRLGALTPLLYPKDDLDVLHYEEEDGEFVEPVHFVPLLPTLLLNGAEGIGTGWSTTCYGYHPMTVLDNVLAHAEGLPMVPMVPWAAGFIGEIELRTGSGQGKPVELSAVAAGTVPSRFLSRGVVELTPKGVVVTELPLGEWTSNYKEWLLKEKAEKGDDVEWDSFTEQHTDRSVYFAFKHSAKQLRVLGGLDQAQLCKMFQLEGKHSLGNMHAFNAMGELCRFERPEEIIEMHARSRVELYSRRKAHLLARLEAELSDLESRARFISMALGDELPLFQRAPRDEVVKALRAAKFTPYEAVRPRAGDARRRGSTADADAADADDGARRGEPYEHLLKTRIDSLTEERVVALEKEVEKKKQEASELRNTSELQMWKCELDKLRPKLAEHLKALEATSQQTGTGGLTSKTAKKRPTKGKAGTRKKQKA